MEPVFIETKLQVNWMDKVKAQSQKSINTVLIYNL